jgi:hypothetical protein
MKYGFLLIALLGAVLFPANGQDSLCQGRALNIPFHHYGISIGNSCTFNGIRLNFADKYVNRINGINLTLWISLSKNQQARVNGLSLGLLPAAFIMQPVNIGLIGVGTMYCSRGISLGGLIVGGDVIGLSIAGLGVFADGTRGIMRGVALGGLGVMAPNALSGISIAGLGVGTEGNINGLAVAPVYLYSNARIRGLTVTAGYLNANHFSGIAVAGYARSVQMHGLSIALINQTDELHGVQLGLLNLAKNNPKGLRLLPLMNFHFGWQRMTQ